MGLKLSKKRIEPAPIVEKKVEEKKTIVPIEVDGKIIKVTLPITTEAQLEKVLKELGFGDEAPSPILDDQIANIKKKIESKKNIPIEVHDETKQGLSAVALDHAKIIAHADSLGKKLFAEDFFNDPDKAIKESILKPVVIEQKVEEPSKTDDMLAEHCLRIRDVHRHLLDVEKDPKLEYRTIKDYDMMLQELDSIKDMLREVPSLRNVLMTADIVIKKIQAKIDADRKKGFFGRFKR